MPGSIIDARSIPARSTDGRWPISLSTTNLPRSGTGASCWRCSPTGSDRIAAAPQDRLELSGAQLGGSSPPWPMAARLSGNSLLRPQPLSPCFPDGPVDFRGLTLTRRPVIMNLAARMHIHNHIALFAFRNSKPGTVGVRTTVRRFGDVLQEGVLDGKSPLLNVFLCDGEA